MLAAVTPEAKLGASAVGGAPQQGSELITIRSGSGVEPALFCVHAEAGDVSLYYNLAAHLPGGRPILGVPAPGPGGARSGRRDRLARRSITCVRSDASSRTART